MLYENGNKDDALEAQLIRLQTLYQQAELRATEVESRALRADARAQTLQEELQVYKSRLESLMAELTATTMYCLNIAAQLTQAQARYEQAELRAAEAESRAQQAEGRADQMERVAAAAENKAKEVSTQLHAVYASVSWKMTAPLRGVARPVLWMFHKLKGMLADGDRPRTYTQGIMASILRWGVKGSEKFPRLKGIVLRALNYLPGLDVRLRQIYDRSRSGLDVHQEVWNSSIESGVSGAGGCTAGRFYERNPKAALEGINAHQRTPLEAYFHNYRKEG